MVKGRGLIYEGSQKITQIKAEWDHFIKNKLTKYHGYMHSHEDILL